MSRIVCIHQPNFYPWLGLFDKIAKSDAFVVLDDVQFPKKGGTWTNRVQILASGAPHWLTAPIQRNYSGFKKINEIEFFNKNNWRQKMLKTIEVNYRHAPFFSDIYSFVEDGLHGEQKNVSTFNSKVIVRAVKKLGFDESKIFWSSRLEHKGAASELLVSLARAVNADTYMYGGGAEGYQDAQVFSNAGIQLKSQDYHQPFYAQHNSTEFFRGLSIIDAVANIGWAKTARLF